eukprot:TRINITY_DN8182_c0_g2_i1.p1 TRINITY_DN8182_c0_g2~~TRINITY_DN8182_c0_g2_i1.p1  ORF type:complete len:1139 (-),score=183.35 TRINITY_DN8182_c0_g2_i1:607-4023(-)
MASASVATAAVHARSWASRQLCSGLRSERRRQNLGQAFRCPEMLLASRRFSDRTAGPEPELAAVGSQTPPPLCYSGLPLDLPSELPSEQENTWDTSSASGGTSSSKISARKAAAGPDIVVQPPWLGWADSTRLYCMLESFRHRAHMAAKLDPLRGSLHRRLDPREPILWRVGGAQGEIIDNLDVLRFLEKYPESLDLSVFGLEAYGENDPLPAGVTVPEHWGPPPFGAPAWTIRGFAEHLRRCYADTLTCEYPSVDNPTEKRWLQTLLESRHFDDKTKSNTRESRRRALYRLMQAHELEGLLASKYSGSKRFGLEGCEALIPGLWTLLEGASAGGVERVVIGMAHRGRLNVLVNVLGKKVSQVCGEFAEAVCVGDVKYHLGTTKNVVVKDPGDGTERRVEITLAPNPSHLEAVNPVVLGMTRAKIDAHGDTDMTGTMAVLLHGDAAFSGQGIVAESMQLASLPAYTTGGTVHVVINNLVGFTTDPRFARSSYHCTNVAKLTDSPILHVNADDADAVLFAFALAAQYRQRFRKDIVLDLVCYRRHGHNEQDDPAVTQPLTKDRVLNHPPIVESYRRTLMHEDVISKEEATHWKGEVRRDLEAEYNHAQKIDGSEWQVSHWSTRPINVTGLPVARLQAIGMACTRIPENFDIHPNVQRLFEARRRQLEQERVDWALAEQLAFGSLLLKFDPTFDSHGVVTGFISEGGQVSEYVAHPPCQVRLSGQDVERGTFNQRHAVIYNQSSAEPHSVLNDLGLGEQKSALVCNSSLSELAILGFEHGYSLEEGLALTIWEAQFGDFANCAQPIIDNFIASSEQKWGAKSCLVLMLPHGYEGQGPEHSSGRLERFLQLVDDDADDLFYESRYSDTQFDTRPQKPLVTKKMAQERLQNIFRASAQGNMEAFHIALTEIALLQESVDAMHNMCVANVTTPANVFHVLRRQIHRDFAKPLVLMTPKYLLHHRPCRSPLRHMGPGTRFQRLVFEGGPSDNMADRTCMIQTEEQRQACRRLIFCSGKIFYDLYHARASRKLQSEIALARVEQISPFPAMLAALCAGRYPNAEVVWVQEEPKNMGAWSYVAPRLPTALRLLDTSGESDLDMDTGRTDFSVRYIGRPPSATTATPLFKKHKEETQRILDQALSLP